MIQIKDLPGLFGPGNKYPFSRAFHQYTGRRDFDRMLRGLEAANDRLEKVGLKLVAVEAKPKPLICMSTYEVLILLAHINANDEHIEYAHQQMEWARSNDFVGSECNAIEWLDAVNFENAPGGPVQWVAYAYQFLQMPEEFVSSGLPVGIDRAKSIQKVLSALKKTIY
jgi:hypothetical protein